MRVLVAEDDDVSRFVWERALSDAGHTVTSVPDGVAAIDALHRSDFDVLVTDWMMPAMDGLELVRRTRAEIEPCPIVLMVTAIDAPEAREHALRVGADDYLEKPLPPTVLIERLETALARARQPAPSAGVAAHRPAIAAPPRGFAGVALVASTGGPTVVSDVVSQLSAHAPAAYFVVVHAPAWIMANFVESLRRATRLPVDMGVSGAPIRAGHIYVAPGDQHLTIDAATLRLVTNQDPPENFVRPAGDPLLRSLAQAFGRKAVAVVMTGLGRDGAAGAAAVSAVGGTVLVQEPETCAAKAMPSAVIEQCGVADEVVSPDRLGLAIMRIARQLSDTR